MSLSLVVYQCESALRAVLGQGSVDEVWREI